MVRITSKVVWKCVASVAYPLVTQPLFRSATFPGQLERARGYWVTSFLRIALRSLRWLAFAALGCVGFVMDIDLTRERFAPIKPPVDFVQSHAAELGAALAGSFLVFSLLQWGVDARGKTREQVIIDTLADTALESFRSSVFPSIPENTPQDHNRVTLFRHRAFVYWVTPARSVFWPWGLWRHPWSGWLVITYRSGHLTQSSTTTFLAPDDAEYAEGVAGRAWRSGAVRVQGLPDLSGAKYANSFRVAFAWLSCFCGRNSEWNLYKQHSAAVRNYAKGTNCRPGFVWARLKKKKPCPTAILGVLVQDTHGQPCGVLVMDSCNAHDCIDTKEDKFRRALKDLTKKLQSYGILD